MQQRPSASHLLLAVRDFLADDVASVATDRGLRFRVLIAGNLLGQLAADLASTDVRVAADLHRLGSLLEIEPATAETANATNATNTADVAKLEALLAQRIRDDELSMEQLDRAREALLAGHSAFLAATDPTFDRSMELE